MSGIGLGMGLGSSQNMLTEADMPAVIDILEISTLSDGTLEISAEEGDLTITVLAPSPFAGTYTTSTSALAAGPVNLVPPQIAGTPMIGEVLSVSDGFWIYDAAFPTPTLTRQWHRDGAPISGAINSTHIVLQSDVTLSCSEILDQSGVGQSTSTSNPINIAALTQVVTIPASTVSEDMTNFPVRFDLADLEPRLWNALRADAGNLRATNASDTQGFPLDVVWIDPTRRQGTVFIRQDLTSSSETEFTLRVLDAATTAVDPASTDGKHAVWADYLSVLAFPDRTDRTGQFGVVETGTFDNTYVIEKVSPDIQMHQGIAFDGTHWFVVDTNQIKKFDADWNLVLTENNPIAATGVSNVNHLGDPCIHNGELLIPLEAWPSASFDNQHIAVFDVDDLTFVRSHDISAAGREASAIAINPVDGNLYCTDYTNGTDIPYFTTSGTYLGALTLSQTVNQIQGIAFHDGKIFLSSDTNDNLFEVQLDGTVTPAPAYTSLLGGSFEGITSDGTDLYVLIDSTPSSVYRLKPAAFSDQLQFATNSLRVSGIPGTTTWTASVTATPYALPNNGAVISIVREGGEVNRATAAIRASSNPDSYNAWANSNSWMAPGSVRTPVMSETLRMSYGYNGNSERKLLIDGAAYAVQTGVTGRPGGSIMSWFTGAEDSNPSEFVKAALSFAFLYDGYASDARLAAEYATLHDTRNFYTTN